MGGMISLQKITYNGRVAAVVLAGHALVVEGLADGDERAVRAMCLYALEIDAGRETGPYTDQQALHYAARAQPEKPQ
jgi:hypothetical protein